MYFSVYVDCYQICVLSPVKFMNCMSKQIALTSTMTTSKMTSNNF